MTAAPGDVAALREADLFRLWLEQRFPSGLLVTTAGEPVRVLYRGRAGSGAGPDFRDARISVGGAAPRLGDVELHVAAADFQRHGHGSDPAYSRVVLHVVFDAAGAIATALPGGGAAPVLALRPWVERRSAEIATWLEGTVPWREPCHTAIERLGAPGAVALLAEAGGRRLRVKAEQFASELAAEPGEQVLYRALCGALGLSRNVEPFRALAERVPLAVLRRRMEGVPEDAAAAGLRLALLGAAGFGEGAPALGALPWRLEGLRPGAHPRRRIEGLTVLLVRHRDAGLSAAVQAAARAGVPPLLRALQAPGIGRGRAVELAVNAVLPFLIACGEEEMALDLAATLPAADAYGALTTLSGALTPVGQAGATAPRPLPMGSALLQQGALAFTREWCRRGGCGVCPLS